MMEYCSSVTNSTKKNKHFSGNILSDFAQLCSCVLSHPLYLSYFLFFSPYLVKLLAFLSPLFLTTTLLLLSILHDNFFGLLENLQTRFDSFGEEEDDESIELEGFEEFEVYKIVFGPSTFDPNGELPSFVSSEENPVEIGVIEQNPDEEKEEKVLGVLISEEKQSPDETSGETTEGKFFGIPITDQVGESPSKEELDEEKILGVLISDECCFPAKGQNDERSNEHSDQGTPKSEKLKRGPQMADKKAGEEQKVGSFKALELTPSPINGGNQAQQERRVAKTHFRRRGESVWDTNDGFSTSKKHGYYYHDDDDDDEEGSLYISSSSSPQSQPISPSLSNLGSMRKEKEWRRTLACKLFEERNNVAVGGGEGMDLLWETYEKTEENRGKQRSGFKKKKKSVVEYCGSDEEEEDDDDEEEGGNGQLCCLQALKFSAVKMNFGMGKPGFMKISKAFRGIGGGWLNNGHHRRRQSSGGGGGKKGKNY